ncbi:glycosyltransferase family 2 protein [Methanobacterium sp.]|uniref:glycosyltransferase family 2 protein n=1 Tax=Methanobacterium sp. TaxID=2164 RepID=UPI003C74CC5B
MNPKIAVVILNWNNWKDTIECIESLRQITYPDYNVIVVDNASLDNSLEKIRRYCKGEIAVKSAFFKYLKKNKPIEIIEYTKEESEKIEFNFAEIILIKNDKNYGFAEGNNIGIRYSMNTLNSDYMLLLNNDTVVASDFLGELIKVSENEDNIGFVSPKIYYYNFNSKQNVINFAGGSLNMFKGQSQSIGVNEIDNGQYDKIKTVKYGEGSCLLVKREVLEKIGLFDTEYFAYWEEVDLCIRGYKRGYRSVYAPKARIWHKVSASTDNPTKLYYYTRNKFWFMQKYASRVEYISFIVLFFGFYFWNLICKYTLYGLYKRNLKQSNYFLKGIKKGILIK